MELNFYLTSSKYSLNSKYTFFAISARCQVQKISVEAQGSKFEARHGQDVVDANAKTHTATVLSHVFE